MAKVLGFAEKEKREIRFMIGANLAAARRNAGLTQTDVMQAVWGVKNNRNRISEIENGKRDLTIFDLLIFQDLYKQSMDYILGLSTEPEVDMLAGTVNHIVHQSEQLIRHLSTEFADSLVVHMKSICKNDQVALVDRVKELCNTVKSDYADGRASVDAMNLANSVLHIIRHIEVKMARQQMAIDTQMTQVKERIDKQDGHRMMKDLDKGYQFSLPLPNPSVVDAEWVDA